MTEIAQALIASRAAHKSGRDAVKRRDAVAARDFFTLALSKRLDARAADPDYLDPAWAGDLTSLQSRQAFDAEMGRVLHVKEGDTAPEGYDTPSTSTRPIAEIDRELETYFRHQLGETANTHSQVNLRDAATVVIPPTQWVTTLAGVDTFSPVDGTIQPCRHAWQMQGANRRVCVGCAAQQALQPTMAVEDTEAYQQLQREAKRRPS